MRDHHHHRHPGPAVSVIGAIEAAGAVVWRRGSTGPEVLLIHRPRHDDWTLAKGKREPGEEMPETAVREVVEETGVRPVLGRRLRTVHYEVDGRPKRVEWWAAAEPARPGSGARFVPNHEVDQVGWYPLDQAHERLSYADDRGVLDEFARWPHRTVPFVVLRHTSAGQKGDWDGDDLLRPLDHQGQAQARALVPLLACFGPVRVVSSPAARCLASVEPYAGHIGAPVQIEPAFIKPAPSGPGHDRTTRPGLVEAVTRLLTDGVPTVVCVHRENIVDILATACRLLGAPALEDPSLPKGSFQVLQAAETTLAGVERYDLSGLADRGSGSASAPSAAGSGSTPAVSASATRSFPAISSASATRSLPAVSSASAAPPLPTVSSPVSSASATPPLPAVSQASAFTLASASTLTPSAVSARSPRSRRCRRTRQPISATTATASAISTYSEYRVICS
jgi:8-oxo-dGTP diphosphatase